MKCVNCGAELRVGSLYCANCGKEAQIVTDVDILEDDYLAEILEKEREEKEKKEKQQQKKKEAKIQAEKKKQQMYILTGIITAIVVVALLAGMLIKSNIEKEHASSFTYQISKAQEYEQKNDLTNAVAYYENASVLHPSDVEVLNKLAQLNNQRMDTQSAITYYSKAIQIDQTNLDAYRGLIQIYESKKNTDAILALKEKVTDTGVLALFADYIVERPVFGLRSGKYEDYLDIAIQSQNGASIYYTTDNSDPATKGILYSKPIKLDKTGKFTIKAVCVNGKKIYSDEATAEYEIDIPAPKMPVVSPNGGTFDQAVDITVDVPDNCVAYYTWDGKEPNLTSLKYRNKIDIIEGNKILSIKLYDTRTEKWGAMYRGRFVYQPKSNADDGETDEPEETDESEETE